MSLKLKPNSVIKTNLGIQPNGPVHKFFTNTCYKHMDKYTPYENGDLSTNAVDVETDKIIYNSPYAHYMYTGLVMGQNIPIKEDGIIVGWFSPKGKPKHYTGRKIDYSKSKARGHIYAGPHWDFRMWSAEKQKVINEVQNYMNRGGN